LAHVSASSLLNGSEHLCWALKFHGRVSARFRQAIDPPPFHNFDRETKKKKKKNAKILRVLQR